MGWPGNDLRGEALLSGAAGVALSGLLWLVGVHGAVALAWGFTGAMGLWGGLQLWANGGRRS